MAPSPLTSTTSAGNVAAGALDLPRMPVTAKGRAMRARLVAAAVECFTSNGYHATSVAEITATAGTSHGNFYRYFANVDEVLLCAVELPLARLLNASRRPDRADALDVEVVIRWQQAFFAAYAPDRVILATMREAAAIDRAQRFSVAWRDLRGRFVREIQSWIADVDDILGTDPEGLGAETLAEALGSMAEQLAYLHLGMATTDPTPDLVETWGRAVGVSYYRTVVAARR